MAAIPLDRDPRGNLARLVAAVENTHERVTITRDDEPVAVVMDPRELAGLEDTIELLSTPVVAAALDEGIAELDAGQDVDGAQVLADLRRRGDADSERR